MAAASQPYDQRDGYIWMNGELISWRDARVHMLTHALHYGSAVFEGERVYDGEIFKLTEHSQRLLESAKKQADTDKASLDRVANDAAAAKTGQKDVGVGLAFLSYKEYDKAYQAIERGLSKPGVQNEAEAHLLLGIAALGAGKKEDAQKAFKAVKGDPKLERIANLWSLHARQA
jgi:TolA-binding protein